METERLVGLHPTKAWWSKFRGIACLLRAITPNDDEALNQTSRGHRDSN